MGKRIDLTGQRFGRLTVIKECERDKGGSILWLCKCDCGNEKVVSGSNLRRGKTTSCGCYQREIKVDLTGQKFGRLTVIGYNEEVSKQKKGAHWNCKCDCGNEKIVQDGHLKGGHTTSCGCYIREVVSGDGNPRWKGGITPISSHLGKIPVVKQWFNDCKRQANYTCELTGKVGGKLHTHHLKAFSTIVKEAHELHNIQVKLQVKDYTEEELHKLEEYVASWHKDSSNAVVLCKEAHDLFHRSKKQGGYGQGGNTPEQYEEFRERYIAGEFEGLI